MTQPCLSIVSALEELGGAHSVRFLAEWLVGSTNANTKIALNRIGSDNAKTYAVGVRLLSRSNYESLISEQLTNGTEIGPRHL